MRLLPRTAALGCWPDARQRLLLEAAVWEDQRARVAWDQWRAGLTREQIGDADGRLMATAYLPLRALGADDPLLEIAHGLHRRAWYVNQMYLHRAAPLVRRLAEASIDVLVLKGAALSRLHYPKLGSRPMSDLDLLVRPGTLQPAMAAIADLGWSLLPSQGSGLGPLAYGLHVSGEAEVEIDLHEYALMQSVDDTDLWDASIDFDFAGVPIATLAPADHLLHVLVHGLRWHPDARARWAVDAIMIMRSSGGRLDWERLVERVQARRLTVTVGQALGWLREKLEADVPAWVLTRLQAGPRLRFERTVHAVTARPHNQLSLAVMSLDRYRRFATLAPPAARPAGLLDYLRSAWGVESSREVLLLGGRKLVRQFT